MNRRFATLLAAAAACAAAPSKPHIILVVQDDLGWADTGAMLGEEWGTAPYTQNITKLAAQGLRLTGMHSHWHCSPTRRSILSGRTPIHHGEQLSGIATDDIDLRQTLLPEKLAQAGYVSYAVGKGHTGYKSTNHLFTSRGFASYVGYLSGSQSYFSSDRWQDDHPLHQDSQFVNPPPGCGNTTDVSASGATVTPPSCSQSSIMQDTQLPCSEGEPKFANVSSPTSCCDMCAQDESCSHWVFAPKDPHEPACHLKYGPVGKSCIVKEQGSYAGILRQPPSPSPPPSGPDACTTEYGTDLYGSLAVQYIRDHAAHKPNSSMFLYLAFQDQHTPYDAPPWSPPSVRQDTYKAMMWAGDVNFGRVVQALKESDMWQDAILIYVSDNGGVVDGNNYPKRGEKHSNWEGGMNVASFISGGALPVHLRNTTNDVVMHVADIYATAASLAGVDPSDDPPVPPGPVDPANPHLNIYGNDSFPPLDGVDVWDLLIRGETNKSAAHDYLVASREVVYKGKYKLLVSQPLFKTQNNGWKLPNGTWVEPTTTIPCMKQDLSPLESYLPGVPGQLPCLFDLEADPGERNNLAPKYPELVQDMWQHLNATVLTMRDCSGWSGPVKGPAGSCSPAELLGPCNTPCADEFWYGTYGGPRTGQGPVCDVPTCSG